MKVLVCTDGSEQSLKALRKAANIVADIRDAQVTVLHVEETISSPYEIPRFKDAPDITKKLEEEQKKVLAQAAKIFEEKNIEPEMVMKEGHPASVIVETASEGNYDLVVLGSRGLGGLKKLFLGSVSNAVAQETDVSVLIVK